VDDQPVALPAELWARVRELVGDAAAGDFVRTAVERQVKDWGLVRILDELDAEAGPVPDDLLAEAESFWRAG
jgi:hypothetical protein